MDVTGRVTRVVGPLVDVEGLPGVAMSEVVELGPARLAAEVVALRGGRLTAQAYEYTGGLTPGDPVRARGEPLSARLGPGLLGGVFDGLLRPLADAPTWLGPGAAAVDPARRRCARGGSCPTSRWGRPSEPASRWGGCAVPAPSSTG